MKKTVIYQKFQIYLKNGRISLVKKMLELNLYKNIKKILKQKWMS